MPLSNRLKNQHLLWRAGFGPLAENATDISGLSQRKLWDLLVKTSSKKPEKIHIASGMFDGLLKGVQDVVKMSELTKEQKKAMRQQSKEDLKSLNLRWLEEMVNSEAQLMEKMSLFWHGHFACRVINIFFQQQLLDIIRNNALGNFGDLLRAVSKSPAMLQFLNNQQNRRQHPNENFAREVMELFTMGRGNYSETDVKEAARAFTGWGFNMQGEFVFRKNQHDEGSKTFLGETGNFDGDDIIDILLGHKQTARFITSKIYRYFVNEKVDQEKIDWLADRFFKAKYEIKKLVEDIFTSDWFYDEKNIGTKIKSPIELLAGIRRLLPMELENENSQLLFQRALGQILFYPPNVAGWPGGKSWIDSSTLMLRLRIPQIITANEAINIQAKPDDDTMMGRMKEEVSQPKMNKGFVVKNATAVVDWEVTTSIFEKASRENLLTEISNTVLQTKEHASKLLLAKYLNTDSRENYIKTAIIRLMSTPEYQLC
ncbi:MAG: DUF1800 domain-containing protein [Ferruginibacter sp.]